jgi:hypothetical protein
LFHGALLTAVLGFGLLFDHMAAPAGARSVRAVESLLLVQEQEREAALYAAASDARLRRRPS